MQARLLAVLLWSLSVFSLGIYAATEFTVPQGNVIVCTDSFDNVCTAPTSCNKNGQVTFDSGQNFNVGTAKQENGYWTVQGGYTIEFPAECIVQCQGDCVCDGCESTEVANFAASDGSSGAAEISSLRTTSIMACILIMAGWALL